MLANLVWKFLLILLVFSSQSEVTFAKADSEEAKTDDVRDASADSWDEDDDGDDLDDDLDDQWDNSGDAKPMENALPASLFATIFFSEKDPLPGVMEFHQTEVSNYPNVNMAQTGQSPATLRFFKSADEVRAYSILQAIENDMVPEEMKDQMEQARASLPDREVILAYPIESEDVSDMDVGEIRGLLADHNVHRSEQEEDDDDFETEDDDEVVLGENDGKKGGRRKKTRVDWRKRREARMQEEGEKKKNSPQTPANSIGSGVPTPILIVLCLVGFAGFGYIIFSLFETLRTSEEEADLKKLKSQRKSEKRMKRDKARGSKKRN